MNLIPHSADLQSARHPTPAFSESRAGNERDAADEAIHRGLEYAWTL
jgi:hypothetical protein